MVFMFSIVSAKTVVAMIVFAFIAGFFVQYDDGGGAPAAPDQSPMLPAPLSGPVIKLSNADGQAVFGFPDVVTHPRDHQFASESVAPVRAAYPEITVPRLGPLLAAPISGCEAVMNVQAAARAMVDLVASLPCAPLRDVVIRHDMLQFSAITDLNGQVAVRVPALSVEANFTLLLDNVEHVSASVQMPTVRDYDRVVLQWRGRANLQLHAFEPGAAIGDLGHIWSASVPDTTGTRGTVQRLGTMRAEIPYMAEVYTQPARQSGGADQPRLQIGIALTARNCGRGLAALTYRILRGAVPEQRNLSLILPDCEAVGTVVMLDAQFDSLAGTMP